MGVASEYDHPALAIFDRTLVNLNHIESRQNKEYVFEFTALVGAQLGVLVHPWDQLLSKDALYRIDLDDERVTEWKFPVCSTSRPYIDDQNRQCDSESDPKTLGKMLNYLRNGFAHGNIAYLDVEGLQRTATGPVFPVPRTNDIVGIEVWNCPSEGGERIWGTALTIKDLRGLIKGMEALVNDSQRVYWKKSAKAMARSNAIKLA